MKQKHVKVFLGVIATAMLSLASCTQEIDESNLYTFTGQTISDVLNEHSAEVSDFVYILQRAGLDKMMSSYGRYTCYAPSNNGVQMYLQELWNDEECAIPHHGMTECSLQGLTDSLCIDIAKYHLSDGIYNTINISGDGVTVPTMLNRDITSKTILSGDNQGSIILNDESVILQEDIEATNGVVHICSRPMTYSTRLIADDMRLAPSGQFSIFYEALEKTGLIDSISGTYKMNADGTRKKYELGSNATSKSGEKMYSPTECKLGYTIFAETNDVFRANGINSFEDLKNKCIEWYQNASKASASGWYDYPAEKGLAISTGTDYTNRMNVVNMFIAYHILNASMAVDRLVFMKPSTMVTDEDKSWNYAFGGEPQNYYETMLPHTMLKIWQPLYHQPEGNESDLWINHYRKFNTRTDEVGLMGSDALHTLEFKGVKILTTGNIAANNGYIHPIADILLYDRNVVNSQVERMRFESTTILTELINNGLRFATKDQFAAWNGGAASRYTRLHPEWFDNIHCYQSTIISYTGRGYSLRASESDQIAGWDQYDFALKLPPVPTGRYEIRHPYPPMAGGGLMQFYLAETDPESAGYGAQLQMIALGLPLDARAHIIDTDDAYSPIVNTKAEEEEDYGIASDVVLRNHGYMRGPASFSRGERNTILAPATDLSQLAGDNNSRTEYGYGTSIIRRIVGQIDLKQSGVYWLRIKNLIKNNPSLGWNLDYIELVPIDVVNDKQYSEEWY